MPALANNLGVISKEKLRNHLELSMVELWFCWDFLGILQICVSGWQIVLTLPNH